MARNFLKLIEGRPPRAAIFLSGSGSNAVKLLEALRGPDAGKWTAATLVTDRPLKSGARRIASEFGLPLVEHDIAEFYKARGEQRASIATEEGRKLREEWTNGLRAKLEPFKIDFGVLAGFVPLSNIVGDFPCLNVHPGDLTIERGGSRLLVGLHTIPVERAILDGHHTLRSSVIVAQPYTGAGSEMDSGPLLGISTPVEIDFLGVSPSHLRMLAEYRPKQRPKGGFKDDLEAVAAHNQERLKERGDWIALPPVVRAFAEGRYLLEDSSDKLLWRDSHGKLLPIRTVEFGSEGLAPVPRS